MKKKLRLVVALVVISMFAVGTAFGNEGACPAGDKPQAGQHKEKAAAMAAELKLTPDQEKQLNETKAAHRTEMTGLAGQLKAKRQELKTALANTAATKQSVEPIATQIKALEAQMVDRRIDGILKIKEILTPEQYQKLQSMKEEWQNKPRGKHFGKGRGE